MDLKPFIYFQNVRGLRTKTNTFFRNVLNVDYDIICLCETWLISGIYNAELFDNRYNVYRCDRNYSQRGNSMGGGVLIAVKRDISVHSSCVINIPNSAAEVLEVILSLGISSRQSFLRLYCCYFPQCREQHDALTCFFELISDNYINYPNDSILITGDFNIPSIQWNTPCNDPPIINFNDNDYLLKTTYCFLSFTDFKQFNLIPNKNNRQI